MEIKSKFKIGDRVQCLTQRHEFLKAIIYDIKIFQEYIGVHIKIDSSPRIAHIGLNLEIPENYPEFELDFDVTYYRNIKINDILDGE